MLKRVPRALKITLAIVASLIVLAGVLAFAAYRSYDPRPYHGDDAKGLERLSFVVDDREYFLMSSVYLDFLNHCDLIDAVTNGINQEGVAVEHEARSSWHNVDSALCATVNLYNDWDFFNIDPFCKICRIELYRVFTEDGHTVKVGRIDLAHSDKDDVKAAYGEPDRLTRHKKFVKPVAFVDSWIYYGDVRGEQMAFNFNSDTGVLESIEIQAIGDEITGEDETDVEPIREVTSGKPNA